MLVSKKTKLPCNVIKFKSKLIDILLSVNSYFLCSNNNNIKSDTKFKISKEIVIVSPQPKKNKLFFV